jgi:DUF1680 family protein
VRKLPIIISMLVLGIFAHCQNSYCQNTSKGVSSRVLQSFDHREVMVGGEIGRRIDLVLNTNIPKIDFENDFLEHFRKKSLTPGVRDGFVGIGMLLDGMVGLAYYSQDPHMIERKNYLVEELLKTQEGDGYIGIFAEEKRQTGWDTHEGAYIILALTNDYIFFDEEKSLKAAKKYADYLINRKVQQMCGLDEAFLRLFDATADRKYVDYCIHQFHLPEFYFARLQQSRHVYGHMERALMQLKLYEIEPDKKLLYKPHVAVEFLVNLDALDIIGGSGMWEHFNTSHEGHDCNAETCATAYIIWLMSALLKIEGDSFYGDIMERSIYNALFAAFSPTGDSIRYFTDYESAKEYYPDDYFCCPNNFRRIMSALPKMIYYKSAGGIAVNLYNESSVSFDIDNQKVVMTQDTEYPSSGDVTISLDMEKAFEFEIKLRIPLWCKNPSVLANDSEPREKPESGTFYTLARRWRNGDKIQLSLPMEYRFIKGRGQQWQKVALMRGPVVYGISQRTNPFVNEKQDLTIDPDTIRGPIKDESFRPGGLKCTARVAGEDKLEITFTEFIDPSGIKTHFFLPTSAGYAQDDELVAKHY